MTSTSKRLLVIVLAVVLTLSVATLGFTAFAVTATDTIEYPFAKGDDAFKYAPTWQGAADEETYKTMGDPWQFYQVKFGKNLSLDEFDYLAVQIKTVGNPGLTVGGINPANSGRYDNAEFDGSKFYFVAENGTLTELSTLYGAINVGANVSGTLLMPKASMKWRWNSSSNEIYCFYITTNAQFNYNFSVSIGEIGYYKGEPSEGKFTKLVDLSAGCDQSKYYTGNAAVNPVTFPEYKADVYPFRVGEEAFANAPTWKGQTAQTTEDSYQFFQPKYSVTDLTKATYLAVQIKLVKGNFGFTFGAISQGDGRYGTYVDKDGGAKLVTSDGKSTDINIKYSSITLTEGTEGMLLVPMTSLSWVSWSDASTRTIDKMASIFFETNAKYNFGFELVVGDVGYYVGEPGQNGSIYTSLLDLSAGEKKDSYYVAASTVVFPSEVKDVNAVPENVEYPFAKGEKAFNNAVIWAGTAAGDEADNWQTLKVNFDTPTDLTEATWLVVQYNAMAGSPGITYAVQNKDARYSIAGHDRTKSYMIAEDGSVRVASQYQYDASVVTGSGALLINFNEMGWQFGSDANKTLAAVQQLIFTTNSKFNYNFEIMIGEVGYYTGVLGEDAVYHKLLDVSAGNKLAQITATSDNEANRCTVRANKVDRTQYGAVTLNWLATGKTAGSFSIWSGGSLGTAEMVKDSYGDDAVRLTATGANPTGDQYTATTIADGIKWKLKNAKGITFWARNDSDVEVSFNLEIDICNNEYTNSGKGHNARFNIKQGNRFVLYDVKTGKQTIYMTRPCATLPVGFEGWVFVPFTAFNQAQWSVNDQGAMARNLFIDENNVFNSDAWVSYLAITVHAPTYKDKSFSLNKFGSYTTTPSFVSGIIAETETARSVPTLMDLPTIQED